MTSPPESARVVVVGAGIAGASVAHHLAERGWDEIVVVDQGPLFQTGGSTSHAPGLVFQHNASRTMTRLAQWTVEKLTRARRLPPGRRASRSPPPTSAGPSSTAAGRGRAATASRRGCSTPRRSPSSFRCSIPATILGGLHVADDGIAKARARRAGAVPPRGDRGLRRLRGHRAADRGRPRGRRADRARDRSAPSTSSSPRGIWGPELATLAPGLNVPLVPVEHQLAYTAPLPELAGETREVVHPILRHQDHAMYFRQVADAYAIGNYRHEPRLAEPDAPGGAGRSPPTTSPRRAPRRAGCCRRCATSRSRAPSTG